MPTPIKLGLRARHKELEKFCNTLKVNSEHATLAANAGFWKLGLKNRDECKKLVDEYIAHMTAEVSKLKQESSTQTFQNFIDPAILAKVAEHADSAVTDDSAE